MRNYKFHPRELYFFKNNCCTICINMFNIKHRNISCLFSLLTNRKQLLKTGIKPPAGCMELRETLKCHRI